MIKAEGENKENLEFPSILATVEYLKTKGITADRKFISKSLTTGK